MAKKWTKPQQDAIDAKEQDILVAAAAGSGKTAVLVERIIKRITDENKPVDLDRLLVVTFTNAAALEMRQRVTAALNERLELEPENENLRQQLALLPKASITTIHSFCHRIIRSNFNILGLDPGFRLAETTENELLRLSALEEVIEEMYEDPVYSEDFLKLTEAYLNIKNSESFYILINSIFDFSMSLPNPAKWLKNACEAFSPLNISSIDTTVFGRVILRSAKNIIQGILKKYDAMLELSINDCDSDEMTALLTSEKKSFIEMAEKLSYKDLFSSIHAMEFRSVPRVKKGENPVFREDIRQIRDGIKKNEMETLKENFLFSEEEQMNLLHLLYPLMRCLSEVVLRLKHRFDEKKNAKNLLNYNDLEHGCYQLLVDEHGHPTPLAKALQEQYDEILIDEYQDTSALQEAIFSSIKKEKGMFLVGDVKQSIYRFRNTNPLLFREKKERFSSHSDASERKIILSKNFRSKANILDSVNFIFSRLMSEEAGEIEYNEEEMLYLGAEYPETENELPPETEICMIEMNAEAAEFDHDDSADEKEELESMEAEAVVAASKIGELITSRYQVLGKDGVRPIQYRDICILMRSTKRTADVFARILSECGIPCYSDVGSSFLQSEEITTMLSLLKIVDNPHQDIPLLAVLRSQLYAFSSDELAEIRLESRYSDYFDAIKKRAQKNDPLANRLKTFLNTLRDFREKSRQLNMAEFIWYLYMKTGFYESQATLVGGNLRRMNLRLLYIRASAFEKTGLKGLYSFINFIDKFQSTGGDYDAARNLGEEQDVVRIMSIHKSKGLEFPVVILAGTGKKINTEDLKQKVLFHSQLGYGPSYVDTDYGITYQNIARFAVKQTLYAENMSEEMRILYVALTRAREKLILLGSGRNLQSMIKKCMAESQEEKLPGYAVLKAKNYLEWFIMALGEHSDADLLRELGDVELRNPIKSYGKFLFYFYNADDLALPSAENSPEVAQEHKPLDCKLLACMCGENEADHNAFLPAKLTVSEIKRKNVSENNDSLYLYPRPNFLKKSAGILTPTEAGIVMHSVMEHLNFNQCNTIAEINAQLDEFCSRSIITQNERESIQPEQILKMMSSDIGQTLKTSKKILREVSFGIQVEAEPYLHQKGKIMIQGMIDCVVFDKDGLIIIDYKTDRASAPEDILEKYRIQLDCYSEAAEIMYSQKVVHRYIYSFYFDRWMEL